MPLAFSRSRSGRRERPTPIEDAVPEFEIALGPVFREQAKKTADIGENPFESKLSGRACELRAQLLRLPRERRIAGHARVPPEAVEHCGKPEIGDALALCRRIGWKLRRVHDEGGTLEAA